MITATCVNENCERYNDSVFVLRSPSRVECGSCGNDTELTDPSPDPIVTDPMSDPALVARRERNCLLAESDFRMVSDAPWDTTAWATYRQALRDLPSDPNWPDVQFPTPPEV